MKEKIRNISQIQAINKSLLTPLEEELLDVEQCLLKASRSMGLEHRGFQTNDPEGDYFDPEAYLQQGLLVERYGCMEGLWNPLECSDDALELAAKLSITVHIDQGVSAHRPGRPVVQCQQKGSQLGVNQAFRNAIVMAAIDGTEA